MPNQKKHLGSGANLDSDTYIFRLFNILHCDVFSMFCLFVWFYLILLPWRHHRITIWWWISLDFFQASSQQAFLLWKLMHPSKIKGWNPKNQDLEKMNFLQTSSHTFWGSVPEPPKHLRRFGFWMSRSYRACQKVIIFSFRRIFVDGSSCPSSFQRDPPWSHKKRAPLTRLPLMLHSKASYKTKVFGSHGNLTGPNLPMENPYPPRKGLKLGDS